MASDKVILRWPFKAAVDLSSKQFTLVKINENAELESAASGDAGFVLTDTPKAGEYGTVCLAGVEKVVLASAVKAGQFVASSNAGLGQVATGAQRATGIALESGEANQLISVLSLPGTGGKG
jgi:hypothetical protein